MARRRRSRKRFRKYLRGQIDSQIPLTTLGANTLVGQDANDVLEEQAYLSSVKLAWALQGFTPTGDAGPILVGVAHSGYSDAEIEEWIENLASWEIGAPRNQEIAKRMIRRVGVFFAPAQATETARLNNGMPIRTKCGWTLATGQTVRMWAYNTGSSAVATTVPDVTVQGHANLWPN